MNALTPFVFENSPVRVVTRDGAPWFILADVCRVLDIGNPTAAASRLDDDEKNTLNIDDSERFAAGMRAGNPTMNIVSESGLYALILTSRKAEARAFKRWVTHEVLPAIRRNGSYGAAGGAVDLDDPVFLHGLLLKHTTQNIRLRHQVDVMAPQVATLHRIARQEGEFSLRDCAKTLSMSPKAFNIWLISIGWIYRDAADDLRPYQPKIDAGYLKLRRSEKTFLSGQVRAISQTLVTAKGQVKLGHMLSLKKQ